MDKRAGPLVLCTLLACSTIMHGRSSDVADAAVATTGSMAAGMPRVPAPHAAGAEPHIIRVALTTAASSVRISATGRWQILEGDGQTFVARGTADGTWRVEHNGADVRMVAPDGRPTAWKPRAMVVRVDNQSSLVIVDGKRYHGELRVLGTDYGLQVIETTTVEEYLRGVVPLEIGDQQVSDSAAIQAQAVSARSYAYTHFTDLTDRAYDLTAGVGDQVYGGVSAETRVGDAAVAATTGIVVIFGGRVVNAPYHSTCGGETAGAEEVWHTGGVSYLRPVSDRIPGTNRYYCEISPRFNWTRTLSGADLNGSVARYLRIYVAVPGGDPGLVRDVAITNRTASGRVATLAITTTAGTFTLRGDDMRYVLRKASGEILNSTSFSLTTQRDNAGMLTSVDIQGRGYGHGVGMCQWGAIGRARAGQSFRTILSTYYPGTALGVVQ